MSICIAEIPENSLLDHVTIECMLDSGTTQPDIHQVQEKLKEYRVKYPCSVIDANIRLIRTGSKIPVLPSVFAGKLRPRTGKDTAYKIFWNMVTNSLEKVQRNYLGLPANQIAILPGYIGGKISICERRRKLSNWQKKYVSTLGINAEVYQGDVFKLAKQGEQSWNVFDLDLMCMASPELIDSVVEAVDLGSQGQKDVIVNLMTCIGRNISWQQYRELLPLSLLDGFVDSGFEIKQNISGHYRDTYVGVAYEMVALRSV